MIFKKYRLFQCKEIKRPLLKLEKQDQQEVLK